MNTYCSNKLLSGGAKIICLIAPSTKTAVWQEAWLQTETKLQNK